MTPLQQTAQAVIDRWESLPNKTPSYILTLRKALDAELQQAVEPKLPELFSQIEWLENKVRFYVFQRRADQTPVNVLSCTHPAPPPAGKRDHIGEANEMVGECAEFIAELRIGWTVMDDSEFERLDALCKKAADMLEADAQASYQHEVAALAGAELYEFQEATGCDTAAQFKAQQVAVPPGVYELIERWGKRSREALPADAMLINKCIRELILAAAPQPPQGEQS